MHAVAAPAVREGTATRYCALGFNLDEVREPKPAGFRDRRLSFAP